MQAPANGQHATSPMAQAHPRSWLLGRRLLGRLLARAGSDIVIALISLLALEGEGGAPDHAVARVAHLLLHKADVQRALVRVQPGVLHREDPRHGVRLVVVAVPPARRGHEDAARHPVHPHRIHQVPLKVQAWGHQRVHARLGAHGQVQRHRVVTVRLLHAVRRKGVQQAPQHMRERLGLWAGLIPQQHSAPVELHGPGTVADLLHAVQQHRLCPHSGLELAPLGLHREVAEQRFVRHPVQSRATMRTPGRPVNHLVAGIGQDEEVALRPSGGAELALG
mmetsp:Transcript_48499/g.122433  ORF Transcript_48499/g.122433 Transcript_48499/m.122433 type:complete len:279 (-) Transcript_48499:70-906(-)